MIKFIKKQKKKIQYLIFLSILFHFLSFPLPTLANIDSSSLENTVSSGELHYKKMAEIEEFLPIEELDFQELALEPIEVLIEKEEQQTLPKNKDIIKKVLRPRLITAYTSEVAQCDSSPCITANGFNVCKHGIEDTIAANFLPLGTKVKIPELFGDKTLVVRDRTSAKYGDRVDVWMISKKAAINFGVKHAKIVVLN